MRDRVEILKNGTWVELILKEEKIKYNALSNKISNFEARKINHSNTFSLPYVSENIIALEINVFSPVLMAQALNKKYPARYFIKDKLAQTGFLVINNTVRGDINVNFIDEALVITDEWGKITFKQLLHQLGENPSVFTKSIISGSYMVNIDLLKNYETDKTKKVLNVPSVTPYGGDPSVDGKSAFIVRYPNPLNNIGEKFNIDKDQVRKPDSFNPFQSRPIFSQFAFLYIICHAFGYKLRLDPGVDFKLLRDTYMTNKGEEGGTPAKNSFISSQTGTIASTKPQYWDYFKNGAGVGDNEGFYDFFFLYPDDVVAIDQFGKKIGVSSKKPRELRTYVPSHNRPSRRIDLTNQNCIVEIESNPFIGEVIWTAEDGGGSKKFDYRGFWVKSVWLNSAGHAFEAPFNIAVEEIDRKFTITGDKEQLNNTPAGAVSFVGLVCQIETLHGGGYWNDVGTMINMHFVEKVLPKGKTSYDGYGQFLQNHTNLLDLAPDVSVKELLSNVLQQQGLLLTFERDSFGTQNIVKLFTYGAYRDRVQEARVEAMTPPSMWTLDSYISPNIFFTRNYGSDGSVTVQTSTNRITWSNNTAGVTSPRNIGSLPIGTYIRLQSTSDSSLSNEILVGINVSLKTPSLKYYDWSKYHQKLIAPLFNTDYGSQYGEMNEISLTDPFPGNIGRIQISTNITSKGFQTKLIPLAKNQTKNFKDITAVSAILNTEPYFEYTLKEIGLVKCSFDEYLPGTRKQYNAELVTSTIDAAPLPLLSNVIYSVDFLPIGIKEWYYLVDVAVKGQATFLLPILVLKTFDISLPVYIESLGGFYIVEEIEEYTDNVTLVKVNLIKLPLSAKS